MEKRYSAMEQIAKAGILTGISMMPILPGVCDTDENLEATVRWTAEHDGQFVIAGGLTLADQQRDYVCGGPGERVLLAGMNLAGLWAIIASTVRPLGCTYDGRSCCDWRSCE